MNIAKSALALALSAYPTARAFSPTITRAVSSARVSSSTTQQLRNNIMSSANRSSSTSLKANVLKLSEPAKDLLPGVDVFIFDCDGVIWRVSNITCFLLSRSMV